MNSLSNRRFNQRSWGRSILRSLVSGIILAFLLLFAGKPQSVYAASITVTTTDDELNADGDCSLREAIQAANTNTAVDACPAGQPAPAIDIITFGVTGTITLASTLPAITDSAGLTIDGSGASVTISGNNAVRVFLVNDGAILNLNALTIANGNSPGGSGIANFATLTVTSSTFSGNSATNGGGIFNGIGSTLTVTNSTFSGNSATNGGGIYNYGTLTIANSTVSGNTASEHGGGLANYGIATLTASEVSANATTADNAENKGGGIFNASGAMLTLTNSLVSDNTAKISGGGIWNNGTAIVTNGTISGNHNTGAFFGGGFNVCCGGGILNLGVLTVTDSIVSENDVNGSGGGIENQGTATITRSTIAGNIAPSSSGAGINNGFFKFLTIENSTISGNSAGILGGGLSNDGTATITSTTFSDNSAGSFNGGGAIYSTSSATLNLGNSILANSGAGYDCGGGAFDTAVITSVGYNLIEDISSTCTVSGDVTGNVTGIDPVLGTLADNGGPTLTHALLLGSPAIDAGSPACPPPTIDQRGVSRPQGAACDIGAYELEQMVADTTPPTITITTPPDGATYLLGQVVIADYACEDESSGSGLASCVGTVPNGSAIDTASVGTKTFTVDAADNAGNTSSLSASYNVIYSFSGFFSPVDNPPTLNVAKAGQTVALKWQITDANGVPVTNLTSATVMAASLACDLGSLPDQLEEYASGASGLQNLGDGYYQFNWKTPKSYANSCKTLKLNLGEGPGVAHEALFKFTK